MFVSPFYIRDQEKRSGVKNVIYLPNGIVQVNSIFKEMSNRRRSHPSPTVSTRANRTNKYEVYGYRYGFCLAGRGRRSSSDQWQQVILRVCKAMHDQEFPRVIKIRSQLKQKE